MRLPALPWVSRAGVPAEPGGVTNGASSRLITNAPAMMPVATPASSVARLMAGRRGAEGAKKTCGCGALIRSDDPGLAGLDAGSAIAQHPDDSAHAEQHDAGADLVVPEVTDLGDGEFAQVPARGGEQRGPRDRSQRRVQREGAKVDVRRAARHRQRQAQAVGESDAEQGGDPVLPEQLDGPPEGGALEHRA